MNATRRWSPRPATATARRFALVDRHSRYLFSLAHRMTSNAERVTPKKGKAKAAPKRKAKKRAT